MDFSQEDRIAIAKYSLKYNPVTDFDLKISIEDLPKEQKWRIL
jgi:hypothetical protein